MQQGGVLGFLSRSTLVDKPIKFLNVDEVEAEARKCAQAWLSWRAFGEAPPWEKFPVSVRYRPDNRTIEFRRGKEDLYYVDMDRCTNSAERWEWVRQVSEKNWSNKLVVGALVHCLLDLECGLLK
jgi:superfamily I DNA/RNA helicase